MNQCVLLFLYNTNKFYISKMFSDYLLNTKFHTSLHTNVIFPSFLFYVICIEMNNPILFDSMNDPNFFLNTQFQHYVAKRWNVKQVCFSWIISIILVISGTKRKKRNLQNSQIKFLGYLPYKQIAVYIQPKQHHKYNLTKKM